MEQITVADLLGLLEYVLQIGAAVAAIIVGVKKVVAKLVLPARMDNAKDYIVPFIARLERGEPISDIELERFWEEYHFYRDNNGNSYIKSRVEKLQKDGKL